MQTIDLSGKVALVTGGSRGLGKAISLGLADAGADVIVASRKLESCQTVAQAIRKKGRRALAVSAHTGHPADLDALIDAAYAEFGRVDILINNAGTPGNINTLSALTPDQFQNVFEVNTLGPWYLASRLAPRMGEHGGGVIVNVISVAALKPTATMGFYAATKAALNALTRVMAQEWAPLNVRVNSLAPGSYHSDKFDSVADKYPGFTEGATAASVQKRIADTEEILGPILYLVSDMSAFMTGSTLVSDGGHVTL